MNIPIQEFEKQFNKEYKFLYENENVAGYKEAVDAFDKFIKTDAGGRFVGEFCNYIGDVVGSDREAAAFMFALNTFE